jgi:hypothetical protein
MRTSTPFLLSVTVFMKPLHKYAMRHHLTSYLFPRKIIKIEH